jgi:hypothetical protein
MIGFYYKRKGLQTLFENCFEILEKDKENGNLLPSQLLARRPAVAPPLHLAAP